MSSAKQVIIKLDACEEVAAIAEWYDACRPGLGDRFIAALDDCVHLIATHPLGNELVRRNYRRALLKNFPYSLYYRYQDDVVTVYTVFHTSRNPRQLRKRLP